MAVLQGLVNSTESKVGGYKNENKQTNKTGFFKQTYITAWKVYGFQGNFLHFS